MVEQQAAQHEEIFEWGPPRKLGVFARLPAPLCPGVTSRTLLVVMLGWLPLLVLVTFDDMQRPGVLSSFAWDIATHARLAIAAPLFVLAYAVCARRLGPVAAYFLESGLLNDRDAAQFEEELIKARRRINSLWAEATTLLLAYAIVLALLATAQSAVVIPIWQRAESGQGPSLAGWWNVAVSIPLLLLLLLGWLWRIVVWARLLSRVARFDLQLIAAHPDQSAGLGFLTQSVRAFSIVGMGFGTIVAGRFAHVHLNALATRFTDLLLVGGTALVAVILAVGPLLAFREPLLRAWRIGAMRYGTLALGLGAHFEHVWFARSAVRREMLSEPDFSAATDLYQLVSNVYAMRFIPVDMRSLAMLLGATLCPFVPAMFLSMPTELVLQELKGLLM